MKAKEILSRIEPALKAVHARTTIPIMQTVRLGNGQVIGSDMEMWATVNLPEYDLPDGCVSAEALGKALGTTMPGDAEVTMTVDAGKLVVKGGGRRASLVVADAGEYPSPRKPDDWLAEASTEAFRIAADIVASAMSTNEAEYHLCGVAWGGEWAIGCNGKIILRRRAPRCAMAELPIFGAKVVNAMPATGQMFVNDQQCMFTADNLSLMCRLIDGSYPDYERTFPTSPEPFIVADAGELAALVKAVGWSEASKAKTVVLEAAGGKLAVSSRSAGGEVEASGEIDAEVEADMRIVYNSDYLQTILAPFAGSVTFERDAPMRPARVWQEGADAEAIICEWRG